MARTSRNPQHYTVGIPSFYIYAQENEDDDRRVDGIALLRAYAGIVDVETGKVLNAEDISTCMTPEQIMEKAYVGNITSASLGGEITTLDHTASVEGRKEIDKRVLIRRSLSYTLGFDEPAAVNLGRFFSAASANFPLHRNIRGLTTASGTQSRPNEFVETEIMLSELDVTNLGNNLSLLEDVITQNLQLKGVNLEPLKVGDKDVPYASVIYFMVGDTQRTEDVEVALEPYRNKILCAFFKYDVTAGKLKVQNWPGSGMNQTELEYVRTNFDERVMVLKQPIAETIIGIRTNGKLHDGTTAEIGMEAARWDFNESSTSTHTLNVQLPENVLPGTVRAIVKGKKYDVVGNYWYDFSETLRDYIQAPDNADGKYILRTGVIANAASGASTASVVYNLALHPELANTKKSKSKARLMATPAAANADAGIMPLSDANPATVTCDTTTIQIADDGTISGTINITLSGESTENGDTTPGAQEYPLEFAASAVTAGTLASGTDIVFSGEPSGMMFAVSVTDATHATITASGTTTVLSPAVVNVSIADSAFSITQPTVANKQFDILAQYGTNDAAITITNNLVGDGTNCTVTGTLEFVLSGHISSADAKFNQSIDQTMLTFTNLPAGLTPTILMSDLTDTKLVVEITGTVAASDAVDSTFTVAFKSDAFVGNAGIATDFMPTESVALDFVNNDAALTYNNTLQLSATTAGAIDGNVLFSLSGEVMGTAAKFNETLNVGDTFTEGTHYTITGVPNGLTAVMTKMAPLQVRLTLTGTTTDTGEAYIDVDFLDAMFDGTIAVSDITNGNPPAIKLELDAPVKPEGTINWNGTFKGLDDRTLTGFMSADLTGTLAEFTDSVADGAVLTQDTHYAVSGVPASMTVKATKVTNGRVIFQIEGTAPESGGDQYSPVALPITVGFRFLDAAFKDPLKVADVTGSSQQNIRITFPVAARTETGESYYTDASQTYINHATGEVVLTASKVFVADSGETVGGMTEQSLEVSVSFSTIVGKDVIWSGLTWGRETDAMATLRANAGKHEINGPALVVHQNDVGVSMIHCIPKAVLRPDGTENYAKDDWMAGGYILDTVKDGEAYIPNLTRRVRIPFGWTITYKYRRVEY